MIRRVPALARTLVLLALVAVTAVACSDDDGSGAVANDSTTTSTSSRSTTTTTDPTEALEAEIVEAYEASSSAFIDAAAIPDPDFPAFVTTHVGPMFEQRRGVLVGLRADGRVIRYPADSQYRVEVGDVEVDGDVARFEICGVDDGERVIAATGEVVAGGVVTVEARVAMQRVEGVWKLAERQQLAEWEGVAGCAVE